MALSDTEPNLPPCPSSPHPYPDVVCPKCHRDDISFRDMRAEVDVDRPKPEVQYRPPEWRWSCENCGTWGMGLHP